MFAISSGGAAGARPHGVVSDWDLLGNRLAAAGQSGVYRDIDNAFSAGGHDGSGSPQSAKSLATSPNKSTIAPKRKRSPVKRSPVYYSGDSPSVSVPVPAPASSAKTSFKYYESPIAKKYGFGRATAYQEALANTSYRRQMDDMRKAGLNPSVIYGSHVTYGAGDNIYPTDDVASPGYSAPVSSGGSGGSYRRSRGGNSGKYLFSGSAYYGIMAATSAIAAIKTKSLGAGLAASAIAGTVMKSLNGLFRR